MSGLGVACWGPAPHTEPLCTRASASVAEIRSLRSPSTFDRVLEPTPVPVAELRTFKFLKTWPNFSNLATFENLAHISATSSLCARVHTWQRRTLARAAGSRAPGPAGMPYLQVPSRVWYASQKP
jgi:hypothetical protein